MLKVKRKARKLNLMVQQLGANANYSKDTSNMKRTLKLPIQWYNEKIDL